MLAGESFYAGEIMASGKKNYFRHSTTAFEDSKIQKAIELLGYEGYAFYFILLELMAKQCETEFKETITIHQQTLRIVWRKSAQSCHKVVTKLAESGLFVVTIKESLYEFHIPNLAKYLGRYETKFEPNAPKESKVKERKEKESKYIKETKVSDPPVSGMVLDVVNLMNSILGSSYKPSKSNLLHINARINEKYVLSDFEKVVRAKHGEWGENADMAKYLRPSTLFGTKFESYLQAAKNKPKSHQEKLLEFFTEQGAHSYPVNG